MFFARTRDDEIVVAVYCSKKCAEQANEPRYGAPWPIAPTLLDKGMVCECGKALS